MDAETSKKIQEQGRMSSEEHEKLFVKTDLNKESRERIEQAQRDLRGHLDSKSKEVYQKLEEAKQNLSPFEQVRVNTDFFNRVIDPRTAARIKDQIKRGELPDPRKTRDPQRKRWEGR